MSGVQNYDVTSKLNTIMYASTHRYALKRFAMDHADWRGYRLESTKKGDYMKTRWSLPVVRKKALYLKSLANWKSKMAQH